MKTIVLIQCGSRKQDRPVKAKDMYLGALFNKSLSYALRYYPDADIYILSGKYGLLELERKIEPYNQTVKKMGVNQRLDWARGVLQALLNQYDLKSDRFIFIAGKEYRKHLIPLMANYEIPLEGLRIGEQLHFLDTHS